MSEVVADLWLFVLIGLCVCCLLVIGEIAVANDCGQPRIESLLFREFGNYEDITTIL
jgi:hypothetical protein